MIFSPDSLMFKASQHICICSECMVEYGSCSLFRNNQLIVQELNKISLRASLLKPEELQTEEDKTYLSDFLLPGSVCAVAADTNSVNTVWFVKILEELVAEEDVIDDYGQKVNKGFAHFKGHYMEETKSVKDGCFYKIDQ